MPAASSPGATYYYAFDTGGEQSPIGRTKTFPLNGADRMRFALVSCSNYPAGFFNVYRCIANRPDLDAVVHVGDYIYEFGEGEYGAGAAINRVPEPPREAVTLADYRLRYATYRTDPDLQEAHRQFPFVLVWDDHEMTNDAWSGGGINHNPERGEGDWATRKAAAYKAYLEWMPIRESHEPGIHLYRTFRYGTLVDLVMIDTRGLRDRQVAGNNVAALADPKRTLMGAAQEAWMFDQIRASQRANTPWTLLGQQVMFARATLPGMPVTDTDAWDGYQAQRDRVLDFIEREKVRNLVILTGDAHSSWGFDVPRNPWNGYHAATGEGSLAVELVTPAISSPPRRRCSTPARVRTWRPPSGSRSPPEVCRRHPSRLRHRRRDAAVDEGGLVFRPGRARAVGSRDARRQRGLRARLRASSATLSRLVTRV